MLRREGLEGVLNNGVTKQTIMNKKGGRDGETVESKTILSIFENQS